MCCIYHRSSDKHLRIIALWVQCHPLLRMNIMLITWWCIKLILNFFCWFPFLGTPPPNRYLMDHRLFRIKNMYSPSPLYLLYISPYWCWFLVYLHQFGWKGSSWNYIIPKLKMVWIWFLLQKLSLSTVTSAYKIIPNKDSKYVPDYSPLPFVFTVPVWIPIPLKTFNRSLKLSCTHPLLISTKVTPST